MLNNGIHDKIEGLLHEVEPQKEDSIQAGSVCRTKHFTKDILQVSRLRQFEKARNESNCSNSRGANRGAIYGQLFASLTHSIEDEYQLLAIQQFIQSAITRSRADIEINQFFEEINIAIINRLTID